MGVSFCSLQLHIAALQELIGCLTTMWLPWLQTSWIDSGYQRFTLGLGTSCTGQLERKQAQIIIILQIFTTKQTSRQEYFHDNLYSDFTDAPM